MTKFTKLIVAIILATFTISNSFAQCTLVCNDTVNISIAPTGISLDCTTQVTPAMVLSTNTTCPGGVLQVQKKVAGQWVPATGNATVSGADINKFIQFRVIDATSGNFCWGVAKVEDKLAPNLSAPVREVYLKCSQDVVGGYPPTSITSPPTVSAECGTTVMSIEDQMVEGNCMTPFTSLPTSFLPLPFDLNTLLGVPLINAHLVANGKIYKIIIRKYTFTDQSGNGSSAYQLIYFERGSINNVVCPTDRMFSCSQTPNTTPASTGMPQYNIGTDAIPNLVPLNQAGACHLDATFADQIIPICTGSYKIIRTWTILDWCAAAPNNLKVCNQIIKVVDDVPPVVTGVLSNYIYDAANGSYGGQALPVTFDNGTVEYSPLGSSTVCGAPVILTFKGTDPQCTNGAVNIVSSNSAITRISQVYNPLTKITTSTFSGTFNQLGDYSVTFVATDDCAYKSIKKTVIIKVVDNVKPTPSCDEITQVAITNGDFGRVYATTFNDNSYDNCGVQGYKARRMTVCDASGAQVPNGDPEFYDFVDFTCCDLDDTVQTIMRVYDINGNYNDCMVQVYTEDKVRPTCVSPADASVVCNDPTFNLWNLNSFGDASVGDNCDFDTTYKVAYALNNCKVGTITRTWTVKEKNGYKNSTSCSQRINVTGASDFVVDFPDDVTVGCFADLNNNTIADTLDLLARTSTQDGNVQNFGCGVLAVNVDDEIFTNAPGSCYKVIRTYTVIDWCVYDPNRPTNNCLGNRTPVGVTERGSQRGRIFRESDGQTLANDGVICFTQSIKVIDNTAPTFAACPADKTVNDFSQEVECNGSVLSCDGVYKETVNATDLCQGGVKSNASLKYRWRLFDMSDMSLVKQGTGPILRETRVAGDGDCTPRLRDGLELPYDVQYLLKWEAEDQCGNVGYCEYKVRVVDAKKPSIVCMNGLSAELMRVDLNNDGTPDGGQIAVWASEVLVSSGDNCTATSLLKYGIRRAGTGTGFPRDAQGNPITGVTFSCSDLGPQSVELWAEDLAGNADFCVATIRIQDNMNAACRPATASVINGTIANENAETVQNVQVVALASNIPAGTFTTTNNGTYNINVFAGSNYKVKADKTDDLLNGVTTKDITEINAHILGVKALTSPYQLIAADVNKSGTITSLDMLEIRKAILRKSSTFTNNTSWRFVNKAHTFVNAADPFANDIPEVITLNDMPATATANFVAVKVADVNNSATTNSLLGSIVRNANGTLVFATDDKKLTVGNTYEVTMTADQAVAGYQFTLAHSGLEVLNIAGEGMSANNFGVFADKTTTSYNGENKGIFTLTFKSNVNAQLSEVLSINSTLTPAEAYGKNGDLEVAMKFGNKTVSTGFDLYQNTPNPFNNTTMIGFNLPESSTAKITVYDASGKVVKMVRGDYARGYNQVTFTKSELNATGVLYYQIDTPTHTATKKMVIIE